jgi:Nitrile hydratase, alpha chain
MAERSEADMKKWAQLIAQTWADEKFKRRLIENPAAVLRERGIEMPPGAELRVVENTEKVRYLTLPAKPSGDVEELNMAELAGVAGGWCCCTCRSTIQEFPEDVFQPLFLQGTKMV